MDTAFQTDFLNAFVLREEFQELYRTIRQVSTIFA